MVRFRFILNFVVVVGLCFSFQDWRLFTSTHKVRIGSRKSIGFVFKLSYPPLKLSFFCNDSPSQIVKPCSNLLLGQG